MSSGGLDPWPLSPCSTSSVRLLLEEVTPTRSVIANTPAPTTGVASLPAAEPTERRRVRNRLAHGPPVGTPTPTPNRRADDVRTRPAIEVLPASPPPVAASWPPVALPPPSPASSSMRRRFRTRGRRRSDRRGWVRGTAVRAVPGAEPTPTDTPSAGPLDAALVPAAERAAGVVPGARGVGNACGAWAPGPPLPTNTLGGRCVEDDSMRAATTPSSGVARSTLSSSASSK